MFDITSTKLLILGVVALIVVGPKDLPVLLRTIGKYVGMIKRQAAEFRAQFDDAMRESELAELKKEVETIGNEATSQLNEAQRTVSSEVGSFTQSMDQTLGDIAKPEPPPEPVKFPDLPLPDMPMPELPTKAPDIAALGGATPPAAETPSQPSEITKAQAAAHEPVVADADAGTVHHPVQRGGA